MQGIRVPGDRTVELAELPRPTPGPGECLLEVELSGVCGSDLHKYREADRGPAAAFVIGHEAVGRVVEVGGDADVDVGTRAAVYHVWNCGGAECRDNPKACSRLAIMGRDVHGGNALHQLVPAAKLLPLPDDLDAADGVALVCSVGTAWSALRRAAPAPGSVVGVWGLGPIGISALLVARAMGARVIGFDIAKGRLRLAEELGADAVVDATGIAGSAEALDAAGGPVDVAIETTGAASVYRYLPDVVRQRGRIMLVGLGADEGLRPVRSLLLRELEVGGVFLYDQPDWPDLVTFGRTLPVPPGVIVTDRFPPSRAAEAFALADEGTGGKVAVEWSR